MNVDPKAKTVVAAISAAIRHRYDMGGFQHLWKLLPRHEALVSIRMKDRGAKFRLPLSNDHLRRCLLAFNDRGQL